MTTRARLYGGSDAAKARIMAVEQHLHGALEGQADAGLRICALINAVFDHLDAAPPEARDFYIEQLLVSVGYNYGSDFEACQTLAHKRAPQGKPS